MFSLSGGLGRSVSLSFPRGFGRFLGSLSGNAHRQAGASFGSSGFLEAFEVQSPKAPLAGFVFGSSDFYKTFVQGQVVADGIL